MIKNDKKRCNYFYVYLCRVNYPLDCDLTVNEEFDFPSEEDKNRESSHKYQQNNNLVYIFSN